MTWTHIGDLEISPFDMENADAFACMTRVVGLVYIGGFDQHEMAGLRNLVSVEGSLLLGSSESLTDLSAFECLEEVSHQLSIKYADNLANPSGMSKLRFISNFTLDSTGATVMPTFAPDFTVGQLQVQNNPFLTDLDAVATWKPDGNIGVSIRDNAILASIEGLQSMLAAAPQSSVLITHLPALSSLAGLDGVTELVMLDLEFLPLVEDLQPLAQLEHVDYMTLNEMPKVTDLHGLNALKSADYLTIGGCWSSPLLGMSGLKSLDGLSSLTTVGSLGIGWNTSLSALTGADKLTNITERWTAEFNAVDADDLAAFAAQVGREPCDESVDDECSCFN